VQVEKPLGSSSLGVYSSNIKRSSYFNKQSVLQDHNKGGLSSPFANLRGARSGAPLPPVVPPPLTLAHHLNNAVPGLLGQDPLDTLILHRSGHSSCDPHSSCEMSSRVRRETTITAAGRET